MYRKDRDNNMGGSTAIYVRNSLAHSEVDTPQWTNLEGNSIVLDTEFAGPIRIVSIYHPPTKQLLRTDLDTLISTDNLPMIAAGDWNAKHPRRTPRCTRYCCTQTDIHDILTTVIPDLSSDHNPIILDIGNTPNEEEDEIRKTNWNAYTEILERDIGPLPTIINADELDNAVQELSSKITTAITRATSLRKRWKHHGTSLPQETLKLLQDRRAARLKWHQSWDPEDKRTYNRLTTQIRDSIRNIKNEQWRKTVDRANNDDQHYWHLSKIIKTKKKTPPAIHGRHGIAYSAKDKAEAFAECLQDQFSPNLTHVNIQHTSRTNKKVRKKLRTRVNENIEYTTPTKVKEIIKKLKPRKAPGPDGIPVSALRALPKRATTALCNIISAILR